jgi:hypothetical protein
MKSATAIGLKPCCAVRRDLTNELATSARLYTEAVVTLTRMAVSGPDLDHSIVAAQEAQQRAEVARVAFLEHVRGHLC